MNPKLLILLIGIVLVSIWYFYISPIFKDIDFLKSEIAAQETKLETKKEELAKLESFDRQLAGLTEEKEKLAIALPNDPKVEELMVEFEALVIKSGMALENISISAKNIDQKTTQAKENTDPIAKKALVVLSTQGTYDALKRFIKLSQEDLRLMDIQKINFSSPKSEGASDSATIYPFSIQLETYYY